jgi:chromosome segregation ATPase
MSCDKFKVLEEKIDSLIKRCSELKDDNLRLSQTLAQKDLEVRELQKEIERITSGGNEADSKIEDLLKKMEEVT